MLRAAWWDLCQILHMYFYAIRFVWVTVREQLNEKRKKKLKKKQQRYKKTTTTTTIWTEVSAAAAAATAVIAVTATTYRSTSSNINKANKISLSLTKPQTTMNTSIHHKKLGSATTWSWISVLCCTVNDGCHSVCV